MRLVAVGVSHHTAPVEVRERLAVPPGHVAQVLDQLQSDDIGREAVLISTCNRVELYAIANDQVEASDVANWLLHNRGLRGRTADRHLYRYTEKEALQHLFRVASSLDSMVLGEPQILGQVKDAYRMAMASKAAGPVMHRVMDKALHVAKRVWTETGIGREAVSVGRAGVELARQVLGSLAGRSALLVGAGAHGKLVARSMLAYELDELVVANRTFDRAAQLADLLGATATHLDEIAHHLPRVDVVVTSTGAGRVLIDRAMMAAVVRERRYRPLVMIDLSVPRNIDPAVNDLEGVFRFDVDDLRGIADQGAKKRRAAAEMAESIVVSETVEAWRALMVESVHAEMGAVVRRADAVRRRELERLAPVLEQLSPRDRKAVDAMTRAIVKKVLHPPLSHARALAGSGEQDAVVELLRALGAHDS
jgi:glutamyl-tRNA reductase